MSVSSGINFMATVTKRLVRGNMKITVTTLKKVWNIANCTCGTPGNMLSNRGPKPTLPFDTSDIIQPASIKMATPVQLKMRCMMAVLRALILLVIPAIIATTQEPILEPIVSKIP